MALPIQQSDKNDVNYDPKAAIYFRMRLTKGIKKPDIVRF